MASLFILAPEIGAVTYNETLEHKIGLFEMNGSLYAVS
jgi:hypothetical protein